jgi:carboxyvinyl-carboxyphosphonate phosphorylmutase
VAGLSIEDTDLPAPYGSAGKPRLLSIDEGVGKMRAALSARRDTGLVIAGRTGAAAISSVDDAIARANAYVDAGVDAIFLTGIKTRAELETVAEAVRAPLILGGASKELRDKDWLAARGVRVCLQGHQPFMAAVKAVHDTLHALREGTQPEQLEGVAPAELMQRLMRSEDYRQWTNEWL